MTQPFSDSEDAFSQSLSGDEFANGELEFNMRFVGKAARYRQSDESFKFSIEFKEPFIAKISIGFPPRIKSQQLKDFFDVAALSNSQRIRISFDDPRFIVISREEQVLAHPHGNKHMIGGASTMQKFPLNSILYGPPGTGKTYKTAERAVEICDGSADMSRDKLMRRYEELRQEGRISFVTFHQSYGYEDFVEGLRPEVEDGQVSYRVRPGIFREACDAARLRSHVRPGLSGTPLKDRTIYKMSLGPSAALEGKQALQACLENEYVVMGWGDDIDFSECKNSSDIRSLIHDERPNIESPESHARFVSLFKDEMQVGDIIVVSQGNGAFRAIGEVSGNYEFLEPPAAGHYHQMRAVRWLAVFEANREVAEIYSSKFMMASLYKLDSQKLKFDVLASLITDEASAASKAHVLVIDEINRANISKVFGELITLLESDKREGALNGLTVKLPYSGSDFSVPSNLHILGTMNTADRSIALLDTALRRRFDFEELMPDPITLGGTEIEGINLAALLTALNERIEILYDRDHTIGHAFFIGIGSLAELELVFRRKVLPLLQEYFYENLSNVRRVLNDPGTGDFVIRTQRSPLPADGDDSYAEEPRTVYSVCKTPFPIAAYKRIYGGL